MTGDLALPEPGAGVTAVVLDVGNVLADDVWERMLLTPGTGIVDRLGLDPVLAAEAGAELWPDFARSARDEPDWWTALEALLGTEVPEPLRTEATETVRVDPVARDFLDRAAATGLRVGLATDNTAFWFRVQDRLAGLESAVDPELLLASYRLGVLKRDSPGLLDELARRVDPAATLYVDDRAHNLELAAGLGFRVHEYAAWPPPRPTTGPKE